MIKKNVKKRPLLGLTEKIIVYGNNGEKKEVIARIDTGATKSAIHDKLALQLDLGPVVGKKLVKSSNGQSYRSLINVEIKMKNKNIKKNFTIADRSHLRYKILIGQNILRTNKFLVDPSKK